MWGRFREGSGKVQGRQRDAAELTRAFLCGEGSGKVPVIRRPRPEMDSTSEVSTSEVSSRRSHLGGLISEVSSRRSHLGGFISEVSSRRLQSRRLQSRRLQSRRLQSRRLQSRRLRSRRLRSRRLQSRRLQSRRLRSRPPSLRRYPRSATTTAVTLSSEPAAKGKVPAAIGQPRRGATSIRDLGDVISEIRSRRTDERRVGQQLRGLVRTVGGSNDADDLCEKVRAVIDTHLAEIKTRSTSPRLRRRQPRRDTM